MPKTKIHNLLAITIIASGILLSYLYISTQTGSSTKVDQITVNADAEAEARIQAASDKNNTNHALTTTAVLLPDEALVNKGENAQLLQPVKLSTQVFDKKTNATYIEGRIQKPNLLVESMLDIADLSSDEVDDIRVLLIPGDETTIASTTAGKLINLKGQLGQRFEAGDLLASFDCSEKNAQVEIAQAELAGALDQHEAKIKMQGLDQASDLEVALAASESNKAKAQLKLNKTLAAECKVYAPWSGRVAKAHVRKYMTVAAGEPLLDIVNTGRLKIKLNVPSKYLAKIKSGKKFKVHIDETGHDYLARINRINSKVDPISQTVEIEANLAKRYPKLLAGMSGTADLGLTNRKRNIATNQSAR